jgi:lipopolysaccharide assembly protein B
MQELLFLALFVVALGIGWFLGRREAIKVGFMLKPHGSAIDRQYFIGLNYLLNEQPDEAIETFIRALEVNPETVETHIAIGRLFCQRGDVERAIKVHQNLLARPNLTREQGDRVQYELARDYLAVGMHHRAQRLFDELIDGNSSMRIDALVDLIKTYEREREWSEAIRAGHKLIRERPELATTLAHYHCELANEARRLGEWQTVRRHLEEALQVDRLHVRAMLGLAELEAEQGQPAAVVRWLTRLAENNPDFFPQALPLARQAADNTELDLAALLDRVIAAGRPPMIDCVLARAETLRAASGDMEASRYVVNHIRQWPSLKGLLYLIDLHQGSVDARGQDNLRTLRGIIESLQVGAYQFRCGSCGFAGRKLHWQCPTCHGWSTIKPIKDREAS